MPNMLDLDLQPSYETASYCVRCASGTVQPSTNFGDAEQQQRGPNELEGNAQPAEHSEARAGAITGWARRGEGCDRAESTVGSRLIALMKAQLFCLLSSADYYVHFIRQIISTHVFDERGQDESLMFTPE